MNTFGQNIAAFRKNRNLTQEKLAELIGISPQSVSKWENDVSMPDPALLPILADILSTSIDSLFGIGNSVSASREQIPEKVTDTVLEHVFAQFKADHAKFEEYRRTIAEENGFSTALFTDTNGAVWANEHLALAFRKSPEYFRENLGSLLADCRPVIEIFSDQNTVKVLTTLLSNTTPSSASYIATKAGLSSEETASILEKLCSINLAMSQEVNFDDTSMKLWRVSSTHKMLFVYTMIIMVKKIIDGDNYYCYIGSELWCK